jgi:hypothetical protein
VVVLAVSLSRAVALAVVEVLVASGLLLELLAAGQAQSQF